MSRTQSRLMILLLAAFFAAAPLVHAQEKTGDALATMKKFETAVKLYRQGEYDLSARLLDEVIKTNPTSHEALLLREQAGMGILVKMLSDPKVRDAAAMILRRAAEESARVQRDPATIAQLIEQTGSDDMIKRETAIRSLAATGPFAVPALLDQALSDDPYSITSRRVAALRAIGEMGAAAVPPLLTAFENVQPENAARIAKMLQASPDARAVPSLAACIENKETPVFLRSAAQAALDAIQLPEKEENADAKRKDQPKPERSAAQECLDLAARYYYNDIALIEVTPRWQRVIWKWNPAAKTFAERLVFEEVPAYVYPRLLAESLLLKGMRLPHAHPEFLELYVCNNFHQMLEAMAANDAARAAALQERRLINESLGAAVLNRALARALKDGTAPLARECIMALRAIGDRRPPSGDNALAAALSYPDKDVRAAAAETMMFLHPAGDAGASETVISAAASALGASVRPRVLVLTQNETLYNALSREISSWNMVPERRTEQVEAVARVRKMTPPVSLLIMDTRLKGASAIGTLKLLRADLGAKAPPAILLAPSDDVKKLTDESAGLAVGALPIPPSLPDLMKMCMAAVETAPAQASEDVLKDTEAVKKILSTIAALPRHTKYPTADLVGTLARLTTGYAQDVRLLAMKALASMPSADARDAMFATFANRREPPEIRRAAGEAFASALMLSPCLEAAQLDILRACTADADSAIAAQAAHALSIADASLAEREARLLDIGPKAK